MTRSVFCERSQRLLVVVAGPVIDLQQYAGELAGPGVGSVVINDIVETLGIGLGDLVLHV